MKGAEFLHKQDSKLHLSEEVEGASDRHDLESHKPVDKIENYLEQVKRILQPEAITGDIDRGKRNLAMMENYKNKLYEKWNIVIDEEDISDKYWESQKDFYEKNGNTKLLNIDENGEYYISDETKEQEIKRIQADQKESFDKWVEFMASRESNYIPTWAMVWALKGIMNSAKKSSSDSSSSSLSFMFKKRTKDSVAPYPELNQEALAKSIDAIVNKVEKGEINEDNPELKKAIESTNFQKIYLSFIESLSSKKKQGLENIDGEWKEYNEGDEPDELLKDLENKNTGWCIAGKNTAKNCLKYGKLYIYYSEDENGDNTIPRLAIHKLGNTISEITGIATNQNLDEFITPVIYKKMDELGDLTKEFEPARKNLETLDLIWDKNKNNQELNLDDLKFLYEIDSDVYFFNNKKDPRVKKILDNRDQNKDLETILTDKSIKSLDAHKFFNLDQLPPNMELDSLDLRGTKIKKLPSDLRVNNLIISQLDITSIPDNIDFDFLDISETKIEELPPNLKVKNLIANKIHLESIPNNLNCENIDFSNSNIKKLPEGLTINKLDISSSSITELPFDLKVKELIIKSTKIKEIPNYLELQNLDASNSKIEKLPSNLNLESLNLRKTRDIKKLENINAKYIDASFSKLEELPNDLKCQSLDISFSSIKRIPDNAEIQSLKADFAKLEYVPKHILENTELSYINDIDKKRLSLEIEKLDSKAELIQKIENIYDEEIG